ncbi:MAG TPA: DNA primase [Candidatus Saccharimonadales bacterium]
MDAVEEIKQRLNIEDVIGEYVQLKRAGRNWKGLSPFGNERTPSFVVSPEKQIWHDFSSGKGGSMFSFVMEMEGLDFRGALELLARKAGVDLEQFRGRPGGASRAKEKERLYEVLDLAAKFYQAQLKGSQTALEYVFKKRQFTKPTVLEWRLGYSPNTGRALLDFLLRKGFKEVEVTAAGLTARAYRGGVQDMFRGRLMIPLQDPQGRVIGFTARILADDPNAPKYINTPQTPLYDKSRHVYGLHLAKETIRKSKFVVIAEGNLDVIMSHQAGVRQVVATAGTALTEPNLKALSRFTDDIRLCFDADNAGMNATERAIPIASRVGVSLSILTIPSGKDPDELIKQDPKLWLECIEKPQYALDWLMARYATLVDITSAPGKRRFSDVILAVVRNLKDEVEKDHYLAKVAELIGVSREALIEKMKTGQSTAPTQPRKARHTPKPLDKKLTERTKTQNHFLALVLLQPKLRPLLAELDKDMMADEQSAELLGFLQQEPDFAGAKDPRAAELQAVGDYVKMITLLYEELYQDLEFQELELEARRVRSKLIEQYTKLQKQTIAEQLQTADENQTKQLLERVRALDHLLNNTKGEA